MPHARPALAVRAREGETWVAQCGDAASPASGRIRLSPPLGQKPVGQGVSQTERILSLRNVRHARGPLETTRMPREARGYVSRQPMVCSPLVPRLRASSLMRACGQDKGRFNQGGSADQQHGFPCRLP